MHRKNFSFNLIKARLSETIIQQLFIQCGYSVFHYGMENAVPAIVGLLNNDNSEAALSIRQMPDFVIQSPDGQLYYLEVKYRARSPFKHAELKGHFPYQNAWFIVVTKNAFYCASYPEIAAQGYLPYEDAFRLENRPEFSLDPSSVAAFQEVSQRFFQGT